MGPGEVENKVRVGQRVCKKIMMGEDAFELRMRQWSVEEESSLC